MQGNNVDIKAPKGFKLRCTLRGHKDLITKIAWSPDGQSLLSGSYDRTIRLWKIDTGEEIETHTPYSGLIKTLSWSPDGKVIALGFMADTIQLLQPKSWRFMGKLPGHSGWITSITWSPDGHKLVSTCSDEIVRIWNTDNLALVKKLTRHATWVFSTAWSPDRKMLSSGASDGDIRLWSTETWDQYCIFEGHTGSVTSLAWSPDSKTLASASADNTIRVWNIAKKECSKILFDHTNAIPSISFSSDGRILASISMDGTVRLWRSDNWELVETLNEPAPGRLCSGMAFHPDRPLLATAAEEDMAIRIWELDIDILLGIGQGRKTTQQPSHDKIDMETASHDATYVASKVVMIGDTELDVSSLISTLTGSHCKATEPRYDPAILTLSKQTIELNNNQKETREIFLWEMSARKAEDRGQRTEERREDVSGAVHQLSLNNASVGLVIFDIYSKADPFEGVRYWDHALCHAQRSQGNDPIPLKKILVGIRPDHGKPGITTTQIDSIVQELKFEKYLEINMAGLQEDAELTNTIYKLIRWDVMPKISSVKLFHNIKTFLIDERDSGRILTTAEDLYRTFLKAHNSFIETDDLQKQFKTCIWQMEASGLLRKLSLGGLILLRPELLTAYVTAMINHSRAAEEGICDIMEDDARTGRFHMIKEGRITDGEKEKLLLNSTVEELIRYEIALRVPTNKGQYLVFPSLLRRRGLPLLADSGKRSAVISFEGPVSNIYATLAVHLLHVGLFKKTNIWKEAITYLTTSGETCGILLQKIDERHGELTLFFDSSANEETRFKFEEYVHNYLMQKAIPGSISKQRIFVCPKCDEPIDSRLVQRRQKLGFKTITCPVCDTEIPLSDDIKHRIPSSPVEISAIGLTVPTRQRGVAIPPQHESPKPAVSAVKGLKEWAGSANTTLTIVFTDIVGATLLCNELGNEIMNRLRKTHFEQAEQLIDKYKGYKIKTTGDGIMAAFRTAVEALDFALAFQGNPGDRRIKIRIGVHVGPVYIEKEDAFGSTVDYTARIMNMVSKPEIWLSSEAKNHIDQERTSRHSDMHWIAHANCEMKGFKGKYMLWSIETSKQNFTVIN